MQLKEREGEGREGKRNRTGVSQRVCVPCVPLIGGERQDSLRSWRLVNRHFALTWAFRVLFCRLSVGFLAARQVWEAAALPKAGRRHSVNP